ncbi:MAG: class I SAM-dependent methyltransferase [Anaerolineales bacterium]|nr:class I SAM-dependent methyltransferase [Anaerolineales bacterium]
MEGPTVFDVQAQVGITKHVGNVQATRELVELCHIKAGMELLDVGCGVGQTPIFLVNEYNCRVVGVDIMKEMIQRSEERAIKAGVGSQTEFRVADVQALPFESNRFDAVIAESVIAFPDDKQRAIGECVRVVKPGGYVGINESTWIRTPVPPEIAEWVSQDLSNKATILTVEDWKALLERAGLENVNSKTHSLDIKEEAKATIQRYGLGIMLRAWGTSLKLLFKDPTYRKVLQSAKGTPKNLMEFFGYGLFAGQKPNHSPS